MSSAVIAKLMVIFVVIGIGWIAARTRALRGGAAALTMSNAAFLLFVPAMLIRTMARVDLAALPYPTLAVFFAPMVALLLVVYAVNRRVGGADPAGPAVRAISTTFGNGLQLGLPVVTALFGEAGLSVHIAIISMHALTLMTLSTLLVEVDLARVRNGTGTGRGSIVATVAVTARRAVIHPVVLPVLLGLGINLLGVPIPGPVDEILSTLSQAVAPVCLITIGLSLAHYGVKGVLRGAVTIAVGKLLIAPAAVLAVAHWGVGLHGIPLATIVMFAALPTGSNALLFAQRYRSHEAETTAAIMVSTVAFTATAPLWLLAATTLAP